jgi:hypothetical protein
LDHFQFQRALNGEVVPNYFLNKFFKTEEEKKFSKLPEQKEIDKLISESSKMFFNLDLSQDHNDNFQNNLNSPFISWTRNLEIAKIFAGKGIILCAFIGPIENKFAFSPDNWNEEEVLVYGIIRNATIIEQK